MPEDKFADLREASIERLMRWPFNRSRAEAEKVAEREIQTMKGASERFGKMLERISKPASEK